MQADTGDASDGEEFGERVVAWHRSSNINYPWRSRVSPYRVLIASLLLRKTTRRQVEKLFPRIVRKYPSLRTLVSADQRQLEKDLKPLGIHRRRALLLKEMAEYVCTKLDGRIPKTRENLLDIPGLGIYASSSVLIFAYGMREPLIDSNVVRVFSRVFSAAWKDDEPRKDPGFWEFVKEKTPTRNVANFFWGLIDLAQAICRPKDPRCSSCPLNGMCDYARRRFTVQSSAPNTLELRGFMA